jgi:hypothetical protein
MNRFNMSNESDLNQLKNMYQAFGWNTGAPELGGQAMGSLNDYYKNREMALSDFTTNIMKDVADRRFTDEQAAIGNARGINSDLYGQARGDFADTLSMMQFNQGADQQQFNNLMETMKFMSSEEQRNFLNQQGINDRSIQDWFLQASESYNQGMQNATFTSGQNQQQFTNQMAAAGFDAEQSQWLFQNQATIAQLASQMSQQEFTNSMTAAGFTAQQAQTLFQNTQQVAETGFNQQVTSQGVADQGLNNLVNYNSQFETTPSQWLQMMGMNDSAQNQATLQSLQAYLGEPGMANMLIPLMMLSMQGNGQGTTVNVNGQGQGNTPAQQAGQWVQDKVTGAWNWLTGEGNTPGVNTSGNTTSGSEIGIDEAKNAGETALDLLKKAGVVGAITFMGYTGYKAIEGLIDETKFKNEVDRKDREREGAKTRAYTSIDSIGKELSGSEWQTAPEAIDSLIKQGPSAPKLLKDPLRGSYSNLEEAYAARVGYEYLKAAPELFNGKMTFNELMTLGRSVEGYPYSQKVPF